MNNEEPRKESRWLVTKIVLLIVAASVVLYAKLIWPWIYGRMVKENLSFIEALDSPKILLGGSVAFLLAFGLVWWLVGRSNRS